MAGKASSWPSGARRTSTSVPGPLGVPTEAEWRLLAAGPDGGPTAVIEMSRAAGRSLLPDPRGDDPVAADTAGVGHLMLRAREAGATRIVIGCGGSATTDGGWGAVGVVGTPAALAGVDLEVACDVTTRFVDAAAVFGPQKGASPEQVARLTDRLRSLADRYRRDFGVDVDAIPGAGAAGGLAGGLAALGARLVPGFDLVAAMTGLADRLHLADLVVTGEGHLDPPSFAGKVPGGVLSARRRALPGALYRRRRRRGAAAIPAAPGWRSSAWPTASAPPGPGSKPLPWWPRSPQTSSGGLAPEGPHRPSCA